MRYFLDTEFAEDGLTIDLISIGIVAEDGRMFYREVSPLPANVNPWVKENVLPHLVGGSHIERSHSGIRRDLVAFIGDDTPEFWGRYCDYDWIVLCQLFGPMVDLPEGWPKLCLDLKQEEIRLGNPTIPEQDQTHGAEHNALADARWNMHVFQVLRNVDMGRQLNEAANPD